MKNKKIANQNNSLIAKILTKEKDLKKINPYLKALKKALSEKGVNNIALTGAYGSGKSTIINTFFDRDSKYEHLNISLATFKDEVTQNEPHQVFNTGEYKSDLNRLIEISILQQMFYHVKAEKIPDSRFKRIKSFSNLQLNTIAIGSVLWLISIIVMYKHNYINRLNPLSWTFKLQDLDILGVIFCSIFFIGIGFLTKKLIRVFNISKISKFSFFKGEIELGKDVDKSIFNQHLDEILYFFENTEFNVVVIEDLDRFKNPEVFTKLREINLLLNNSNSIDREINFIYAIRDDMFKNEERTKFFDYIIPVIPFINPSNSNEKLTELIDEAGLTHDFTEDFKDSVITFIDDIDMRLLTNIFHEYTIYKECLLGDNLIQDNLLAVIIYKNLYPKDFVELGRNKGDLFNFFNNKKTYREELINSIDQKINTFEEVIFILNEEQISNVKELRDIYINSIRNELEDGAITLKINDKYVKFSELNNDDCFTFLTENKTLNYECLKHNYSDQYYKTIKTANITFEGVELKVNADVSYKDRENSIIKNNNDASEDIKISIEELKAKKREIESWDAKQIFQEVDITPHLTKFSNSSLMRSLILNGYINENYNHYTTLFHEVSISKEDYDFERNIKRGVFNGNDFKLKKIKNLIKKIPLKFFSKKEILNYELLAFLLNHKDKYHYKLDAKLNLLTKARRGTKEAYDSLSFIKGYINDYAVEDSPYKGFGNKNLSIFLNEICVKWKVFWDVIESSGSLPKIEKDNMLVTLISNVENKNIISLDSNSNLSNYISSNKEFLSLMKKEDEQKACALIQELNIKFKKLDKKTEQTKKMFDFIYENNYYELNIGNLTLMCKTYNTEFEIDKFNSSNYTYITNSNSYEYLNEYIKKDINKYVGNIMIKLEDNDLEDEISLINIYNNNIIEDALKVRLIERQKNIITDLVKVEEESIYPNFLVNDKIQNTWNNILAYYKSSSNSIDEILVEHLNKEDVYSELSKYQIKDVEGFEEELKKDFTISLIKANDLRQKSYSSLIKSTSYTWKSIKLENLNELKVLTLIESKKLSPSDKNLEEIQEYFPSLSVKFLEIHQDSIVSDEEIILGDYDLIDILKSSKFKKQNKLAVITNKFEEVFLTENSELGKLLCNTLANYEKIKLSFNEINNLFKHSNSIEDRVKLLNMNFDSYEREEIKQLIESLGEDYNKIFTPHSKPSFNETEYNIKLARSLDENGYVSSIKIEKKKVKIFPFNKE